jgi:CubicO group peptidase (beta-lactamase class C family)
MFSIQIDLPQGFFGRTGYSFGLAIYEDFLGHRFVSHGGSTGMSSAYFAFIPELNIGVVTAANMGNGMGGLISQSSLSILMGKDPEESIPFFRIQDKMKQLSGEYTNYKKLARIKVFIENGMLVGETKFGEVTNKYALIPEDLKLSDNRFYLYSFGNKTPVKFDIKEDGNVDLFIERNYFQKVK